MSIKITYFVHGTTNDNEQNKKTGWAPGELSQKGIHQSINLGKIIDSKKFDIIFTSDLQRAIDSTMLAFGGYPEIDKRLRECDYGSLTGSLEYWDPTRYINNPHPKGTKYNGESYKDVENRMADFLEFLKENYQGKHIAIVAHQGPQLAQDVLLKNKTWKQAFDEDWRKTGNWQPGWEYKVI